jgi:cholesterol oxidase
MLGATVNPKLFAADHALRDAGKKMGVPEENFSPTEISVHFGEQGKTIKDPYFDGKGPDRTGCIQCGECMTGCRHNAKNTLDKNYLYLAEKLGLDILAEHEVKDIIPQGKEGENGYELVYDQSTSWFSKKKKIKCKGVIFSGGVMGTMPLLLFLKDSSLSNLSDKTGAMVRSNNEALILATTADNDLPLSDGPAIGSMLELDENTHVEPTRYGKGSGIWRLMMMPMVTEPNFILRMLKLVTLPFVDNFFTWLKVLFVRDYGKSTTVLLVMQHLDSTLKFEKGWFGRMKSGVEEGKTPTAFIPEAHAFAKKYAEEIGGKAQVMFTETLTGIPNTAHILGGACMGANKEEGVIDSENRVFGYKNMFVFDGSMVSANPGVNPSLTITAITELGMTKIPKKGA